MQWSTLTVQSATPAEVGGYGTVDAADARQLAAAAARDPAPGGASPRCTPTAPPPTAATRNAPAPRPRRSAPCLTHAQALLPDPTPGQTRRPEPGRRTGSLACAIRMTPITRGSCDHHHAEAAYRPSRKLRHLVRARNARRTAPGLRPFRGKCDLDHTIAWDHGGLTCECDLAPLCRHHHRCKQAEGWHLEQPQPGVTIRTGLPCRWSAPDGHPGVCRIKPVAVRMRAGQYLGRQRLVLLVHPRCRRSPPSLS